jgi:hypothetical protein
MTKKKTDDTDWDPEVQVLKLYIKSSQQSLKHLRTLAQRLFVVVYALQNDLAPISEIIRELDKIRDEERKC